MKLISEFPESCQFAGICSSVPCVRLPSSAASRSQPDSEEISQLLEALSSRFHLLQLMAVVVDSAANISTPKSTTVSDYVRCERWGNPVCNVINNGLYFYEKGLFNRMSVNNHTFTSKKCFGERNGSYEFIGMDGMRIEMNLRVALLVPRCTLVDWCQASKQLFAGMIQYDP